MDDGSGVMIPHMTLTQTNLRAHARMAHTRPTCAVRPAAATLRICRRATPTASPTQPAVQLMRASGTHCTTHTRASVRATQWPHTWTTRVVELGFS